MKTYSDRYWKMFNEIDGNFYDVVISTFKAGLPAEHSLRKSLTGKPVTSVCQLIDRIDKYKRVEEDQLLEKGKAKVIPQERRDFRSDQYNNNNRPGRDFAGQSGPTNTQAVNAMLKLERRGIQFLGLFRISSGCTAGSSAGASPAKRTLDACRGSKLMQGWLRQNAAISPARLSEL